MHIHGQLHGPWRQIWTNYGFRGRRTYVILWRAGLSAGLYGRPRVDQHGGDALVFTKDGKSLAIGIDGKARPFDEKREFVRQCGRSLRVDALVEAKLPTGRAHNCRDPKASAAWLAIRPVTRFDRQSSGYRSSTRYARVRDTFRRFDSGLAKKLSVNNNVIEGATAFLVPRFIISSRTRGVLRLPDNRGFIIAFRDKLGRGRRPRIAWILPTGVEQWAQDLERARISRAAVQGKLLLLGLGHYRSKMSAIEWASGKRRWQVRF